MVFRFKRFIKQGLKRHFSTVDALLKAGMAKKCKSKNLKLPMLFFCAKDCQCCVRLFYIMGRFLVISIASIAKIMTVTITTAAIPNSNVPVDATPLALVKDIK